MPSTRAYKTGAIISGATTDGTTIVADSAATTGLRYQSAYNGNGVINGGLDIWQRGTSFALTTPQLAYTADRWLGRHLGTNVTYSQQASGLTGFQYGIRVQRPNGVSGTDAQVVYYQLETADSYRFAGQAVAISFYAKAGANFSATSSVLNINAISGTGTNQNIGNGAYTGQATIVNQNVTLTTSYQRFTVTGTVNSNATQIGLLFGATPVGTAGANDWYEITGLQLELGSVATSFKRAGGGTLQGELAACQRYYWRNTTGQTYGAMGWGLASSTTAGQIYVKNPVTMRVVPTSIDYSTVRLTDLTAIDSVVTNLTITTSESSPEITKLVATVGSGLTQYRPTFLTASASATAYIGFSAEL
jgi:hypothetical protein